MWQTQSVGPVRTAHISVLWTVNIVCHTIQHRAVLIILRFDLRTIIITRMLSNGREGKQVSQIKHLTQHKLTVSRNTNYWRISKYKKWLEFEKWSRVEPLLLFLYLLKSSTPSTPAVSNCCCSKGSAPYRSNPSFLIFDIRAPVSYTHLTLPTNREV